MSDLIAFLVCRVLGCSWLIAYSAKGRVATCRRCCRQVVS